MRSYINRAASSAIAWRSLSLAILSCADIKPICTARGYEGILTAQRRRLQDTNAGPSLRTRVRYSRRRKAGDGAYPVQREQTGHSDRIESEDSHLRRGREI